MTKKQKAIEFITTAYKTTGTFPDLDQVVEASGSTKTTCAALANTMRTVLGAPRAERTGGNFGRASMYKDVVEAAKSGNVHNVPAKDSTIRAHLNKAVKNGDLKKVVSYQ